MHRGRIEQRGSEGRRRSLFCETMSGCASSTGAETLHPLVRRSVRLPLILLRMIGETLHPNCSIDEFRASNTLQLVKIRIPFDHREPTVLTYLESWVDLSILYGSLAKFYSGTEHSKLTDLKMRIICIFDLYRAFKPSQKIIRCIRWLFISCQGLKPLVVVSNRWGGKISSMLMEVLAIHNRGRNVKFFFLFFFFWTRPHVKLNMCPCHMCNHTQNYRTEVIQCLSFSLSTCSRIYH